MDATKASSPLGVAMWLVNKADNSAVGGAAWFAAARAAAAFRAGTRSSGPKRKANAVKRKD